MGDYDTFQYKAFLNRKLYDTSTSPNSHPYRQGQRTISYVTPEILEKLKSSRTVVENGVTKIIHEPKVEEPQVRGIDLVVPPSFEDENGRVMIDGKVEKFRKWNAVKDVELDFKVGSVQRRKRKIFNETNKNTLNPIDMRQNNHNTRHIYQNESIKLEQTRQNSRNELLKQVVSKPIIEINNKNDLKEKEIQNILKSENVTNQKDKFLSVDYATNNFGSEGKSSRAISRRSFDSSLQPKNLPGKLSIPVINTRVRNNPAIKRLQYEGSSVSYSPNPTPMSPRKIQNRFTSIQNEKESNQGVIKTESETTSVISIPLSSYSSCDKSSVHTSHQEAIPSSKAIENIKNFMNSQKSKKRQKEEIKTKSRIVNSPRIELLSPASYDKFQNDFEDRIYFNKNNQTKESEHHFKNIEINNNIKILSKINSHPTTSERNDKHVNNRISVSYVIKDLDDVKTNSKKTIQNLGWRRGESYDRINADFHHSPMLKADNLRKSISSLSIRASQSNQSSQSNQFQIIGSYQPQDNILLRKQENPKLYTVSDKNLLNSNGMNNLSNYKIQSNFSSNINARQNSYELYSPTKSTDSQIRGSSQLTPIRRHSLQGQLHRLTKSNSIPQSPLHSIGAIQLKSSK